MHKNTVNPLRISQESLDLDDIISDLNSQSDQNQSSSVLPSVKGDQIQARPKTSSNNKGKIEAAAAATNRTSSKGKRAAANKENDALVINRQAQQQEIIAQTVAKAKIAPVEALLTTQATTQEKAYSSIH